MPIHLLLSRRYLRQRWDRALLIVASIALGVATLVSTQTLNRVFETATLETVTPLKGQASYSIDNGEFGVRYDVVRDLRAANLPGVLVQPVLLDRVTLPSLDSRPAVLLGADLSVAPTLNTEALKVRVVMADALAFAVRGGAIVSKVLHDALKEKSLTLRIGNKQITAPIVGYFELDGDSPLAALGRNVIILELTAAGRFVHAGGPLLVNRVDIACDAPSDALRERVQSIVAGRGTLMTPEIQGKNAREIIGGMQTAFTLCSLAALVVGLFLVYNAMAVTVAERRPDIGVLRAVGATRGQIVVLFATIAAGLGLVGAALGVPLGMALAGYALSEFHEVLEAIFLSPEVAPGSPTFATVLLAIVAGVTTAVLAALIPAIQAATDPPATVVRRRTGALGRGWRWLHRGLCLLLIGGGMLMMIFRHALPHRLGGFGGMMIALVGLLLAAPIFVAILVAILNPLLRRVLPLEARLAADNLTRAPGRTGVVIGALAAGVAVMIQTAGVGRSNETPVVEWLDRMLRADFYVMGGGFAAGMSSQSAMAPSVVADLNALPGVERATGLRFARPAFNDTIVYLIAVDTGPFSEMLAKRSDLHQMKKYRLATGCRVLVSDNFAHRHKVRIGDTFVLTGANGPVTLEVAETVVDYSWTRGTIIMDRAAYATHFGDDKIDLSHVFLADSDDAAAKKHLDDYLDRSGLTALPRQMMRDSIGGLVTRFYALAYLQQVVVGAVAALGVVTALLISVLQRKRELGLLLAVGATPAQVVRSVLWEALLMGALGTLFGIVIGLPLEWYVVKVIFPDESGFTLDVLIPWRPLLLIAAGSMLLAALAGLLPAWHAVRTRIVDAIAYE